MVATNARKQKGEAITLVALCIVAKKEVQIPYLAPNRQKQKHQ